MSYTVIIPARYASRRLPGKTLVPIRGKPLLQHVYESAAASGAARVLIATDSEQIYERAGEFATEVMMSPANCRSGSDRVAAAAAACGLADDTIVINVQGDEYDLSALLIDQLAEALAASDGSADMITLCEALDGRGAWQDRNVVKVVRDHQERALYFSRSPIPWQEDFVPGRAWRHIGLYAATARRFRDFARLPDCPLENQERLEQLRALCQGWTILTPTACVRAGTGIDTRRDLEKANADADSDAPG